MAKASADKTSIWYGYLDAGDKSSLVAVDPTLESSNPQLIFIFNLSRNKIIEYRRDIVESKLRDLKSNEAASLTELKKAFAAAREAFQARKVEALAAIRDDNKSHRLLNRNAEVDTPPIADETFFEDMTDE